MAWVTGYDMAWFTAFDMAWFTGYDMAWVTGYDMAWFTGYDMAWFTGYDMAWLTGYDMTWRVIEKGPGHPSDAERANVLCLSSVRLSSVAVIPCDPAIQATQRRLMSSVCQRRPSEISLEV